MNEVPPGQDEADDADDLYRRASALDDSRPSERVRRRVLDHAAQLAAERAAQISAAKLAATRAANRRWRRPAIFGTLAAAALAGLLVTPRFFTPEAPPPTASQLPTASLPPQAATPPAAESHLQEAQAPAVSSLAPQRTPARTAESAAKNSLAAPKIMDSARSKAAASADIAADARRGQDVAASQGATAARRRRTPLHPRPRRRAHRTRRRSCAMRLKPATFRGCKCCLAGSLTSTRATKTAAPH